MKTITTRSILFWGALSYCVLLSAAAFGADPFSIRFPDTPVPRGSQWSWVGKQMVVDNVPMSVKTFVYHGAEADMVAHFENFWRTEGNGSYTRSKLGPKSVLGFETPDFYWSVQYEVSKEIISGKVVVTKAQLERARPSKSSISKAPGSRIISRIESSDEGQLSETLMLLSERSIKFNAGYYSQQFLAAGWIQTNNRCSSKGCVIDFQSDSGLLQISIKDLPGGNSKQSRILIHLIKQ